MRFASQALFVFAGGVAIGMCPAILRFLSEVVR